MTQTLLLSVTRGSGFFYKHTNAEASVWVSGPLRSPGGLWECIRWWVGECAAWWPKFSWLEWCRVVRREGRTWMALCSIDYTGPAELCVRCRAGVGEPSTVNRAWPRRLYKAAWPTAEWQRLQHAQPAHQPSCTGNELQSATKLFELLPVAVKIIIIIITRRVRPPNGGCLHEPPFYC